MTYILYLFHAVTSRISTELRVTGNCRKLGTLEMGK
jgi:hypothetical protein